MRSEFRVRPLALDTDLPTLADLINATTREQANRRPATEATLREYDLRHLPDETFCELVVVNSAGMLCGFGQAGRRAYYVPGVFGLHVLIAPDVRRQGAGSLLYDALTEWTAAQGATSLTAEVRDDCTAGQTFATKRGFVLDRHTFSSTLDIAAFDDRPFAGTLERLEAQGLRFFSLADVDSPEAQRKLYDLNTLVGLDVPGSSPDSIRPFEAFAEDVFAGYWFRPDGQIFVADGETWVGMCAVGEVAPGVMANMMTGVLPGYRGRQIALALKLRAVAFCRQHGARVMQTGNDSTNAPMLAVNRKMGYRADPGLYHLSKSLAESEQPNAPREANG